MKRNRTVAGLLAALVLISIPGAAIAQGPGGPGGPPPMGGPGPRGPRFGLEPVIRLLGRPEVRDELNLTDAQAERIDAIADADRPQGFDGPGRGGPGQGGRGQGGPGGRNGQRPDRAAMEARMKATDAKVSAVLTDAQNRRVSEIRIQLAGLGAAFDPEVQAQLGLSDAQKTALKALAPQGGPGGRGRGGPMGGPPPEGGPGGPPPDGGFGGPPPMGGPGGRGRGDDRRRQTDAKIARILTDAQKARLKALGGKPLSRPGE